MERLSDISPAYLWPEHSTRAATFENPSAAPGGGNLGRKERPNKLLDPGERVTLLDVEGSGTGTVRLLVLPNNDEARSTILTIAGEPFTLRQDGAK